MQLRILAEFAPSAPGPRAATVALGLPSAMSSGRMDLRVEDLCRNLNTFVSKRMKPRRW
jgi:hypothetical protein